METLQAAGLEAVPVQDWDDLLHDPQLAARGHLQPIDHALLGECFHQHNGFRLSDAPARYPRSAPLLGEHNREVLADFLGYGDAEIERLEASGGVE